MPEFQSAAYVVAGQVVAVDAGLAEDARGPSAPGWSAVAVQFVPETGWKGAPVDTLTFLVDRDCDLFLGAKAGERYLVFASAVTPVGSLTRAGEPVPPPKGGWYAASGCGHSAALNSAGAALSELGAPRWKRAT